ncbi:Major facilitator superfamily domain,Acetyl-coenzyme A transporter 1 [Cinara cedri]|uniref:Major facilitator superfamily domain,Acetyl-coenzyme A transporter 1 n=1 Tax=Cinara cedri TaxID=506608 RepID=A0A5E4N048_9HEMI|nr:Major facilitator superfamily domain,Acetyl-coenzyme A transporter 1 [Cinara cedri]
MVDPREHEQQTHSLRDDSVKQNLKGDWLNFFLLLLLYTMQGLPLGISMVLPITLQSKNNTTYHEQALLSFTNLPFSFKLLLAPLVDAIYVQKLGRRKSWLIPVQYILGATLVYTATNIDELLPETGKANIIVLTFVFFIINLLAATQDITVDGWALTMLKRKNVGYASTCNSAGQTAGVLIGSTVPILLTSEKFCNEYLRAIPGIGGIVTMKWILYSLGVLFVLITTLIAIFKKEKDIKLEDNNLKLNIVQTYKLMWDILMLPSIQIFVLALLTIKIGFATTDVTTLKLIDAGVSKENITITNTVLMGVNIIITLIASKYTTGKKSMIILVKSFLIRLTLNIPFAIFVFYTPQWMEYNRTENISMYYLYATFIILLSMQQVVSNIMFVCTMAVFSQKSDPRFGSTYMTLLNTFANLGNMLSNATAFGIIDILTFKRSSFDPENKLPMLNCLKKNKGDCEVDGYYIEVALFSILGIVWYVIFKNILKNLQYRSISHWTVNVNRRNPTTENSYSLE